ncbi:hypothetical protein [Pseudonocardia sp.]|uniref:hypothetical protein n=1 Tax=Pseudonocardia sp. TaxID=60912 RepID=UPI00262E967B|nr:hypothetical protein [Pseudonocardia sp.]
MPNDEAPAPWEMRSTPATPTLPADSAVVDSDPLSIDREKLDPIRTEATVIDGEVVFGGL